MVKVGDEVVSISDTSHDIHIGNKYIVTGVDAYYIYFNDDGGTARQRDIRCYRAVEKTPPQKITQNGYEYSLVGPVKPEWLVDGAWVVSLGNGEIGDIVSINDNFVCVKFPGDPVQMRYETAEFAEYFRPLTAKDWKWGMWAMYDGKRVFVVCPEHNTKHAMISGEDFPTGLKYVPLTSLAPAF